MLQFFTATMSSSVLTVLVLGLLACGYCFFAEIFAVYQRIRFALDKRLRHKITWLTLLWLPVRLYVIIMIPQIFYIFFTEIIKFS